MHGLVLRRLCPWPLVLVRVVLEAELAERALELALAGVAPDAQDLVVVGLVARGHPVDDDYDAGQERQCSSSRKHVFPDEQPV